jgi:hypothetical protein
VETDRIFLDPLVYCRDLKIVALFVRWSIWSAIDSRLVWKATPERTVVSGASQSEMLLSCTTVLGARPKSDGSSSGASPIVCVAMIFINAM